MFNIINILLVIIFLVNFYMRILEKKFKNIYYSIVVKGQEAEARLLGSNLNSLIASSGNTAT